MMNFGYVLVVSTDSEEGNYCPVKEFPVPPKTSR